MSGCCSPQVRRKVHGSRTAVQAPNKCRLVKTGTVCSPRLEASYPARNGSVMASTDLAKREAACRYGKPRKNSHNATTDNFAFAKAA